jgi:hypothetical protein
MLVPLYIHVTLFSVPFTQGGKLLSSIFDYIYWLSK